MTTFSHGSKRHSIAGRRTFLAATGACVTGAFLTGKMSKRTQGARPVAYYQVDSIAQLKQLGDSEDLTGWFYVSGYHKPNGCGGGMFVWDANDTTSVDNGGTVFVSEHPKLKDAGRWKRLLS